MEEHEPKISLPEALIAGTLLFGIPDAIELALIFVGLDTFWITDAFAFPGSQIYLRIKGVKSTYALAGNVLELVPYLGALPLRTIGFVMVVWLDHHPKAEALIGAAAKSGALPKAGAKEAAPTPKATPGAAAGAAAAPEETPTPKAGPVPAEEIFAPPAGPMEKLQAELAETRPLPEGEPVTLDEENNTVDLRRTA